MSIWDLISIRLSGRDKGAAAAPPAAEDEDPLAEPPREPTATPRRQALRALVAGAAGAAGAAVLGSTARALADGPEQEPGHETRPGKRKRRWGMVIDLDKCTGCQACAVACRVENNVRIAGPIQTEQQRAIYWMEMLKEEEGEYPDLHVSILPVMCNHCDNAPCTKVCPVQATYRSEEGIVAQIWGRCIGCRFCTTACPYTRRYFNWDRAEWPEQTRNRLNPEVSTRPRGVVEKCTMCHQRIRALREQARVEDRTLTDADFQRLPACAATCPAEAITFGDLNDPESEVSRLRQSPRMFRLEEELGTEPKVHYLRESKWQE